MEQKTLPTIILSSKQHRGKNRLFIQFNYNNELIKIAKYSLNAMWSNTHKCWFVDNNPKNL